MADRGTSMDGNGILVIENNDPSKMVDLRGITEFLMNSFQDFVKTIAESHKSSIYVSIMVDLLFLFLFNMTQYPL